jgi:hypothetical protein
MTTHTADHGFHFTALRAAFGVAHCPATQERLRAGTVVDAGWMERLAAWAERQPNHHRLGSWTLMR